MGLSLHNQSTLMNKLAKWDCIINQEANHPLPPKKQKQKQQQQQNWFFISRKPLIAYGSSHIVRPCKIYPSSSLLIIEFNRILLTHIYNSSDCIVYLFSIVWKQISL